MARSAWPGSARALALTSGDLEQVLRCRRPRPLDRCAAPFLDALATNQDVLDGQALFDNIKGKIVLDDGPDARSTATSGSPRRWRRRFSLRAPRRSGSCGGRAAKFRPSAWRRRRSRRGFQGLVGGPAQHEPHRSRDLHRDLSRQRLGAVCAQSPGQACSRRATAGAGAGSGWGAARDRPRPVEPAVGVYPEPLRRAGYFEIVPSAPRWSWCPRASSSWDRRRTSLGRYRR